MRFFYVERQKQFVVMAVAAALLGIFLVYRDIPEEITLTEAGQEISLDAPVTIEPETKSADMEVSIVAGRTFLESDYQCRLFGLIPLKTVRVTVQDEENLSVVAKPVGIYVKMAHVLVVATKELTDVNGVNRNPGENILKAGDYITHINGTQIFNKEDVSRLVSAGGGQRLTLGVQRNGEEMEVAVTPAEIAAGEYKLGVWVKDDLAGVGTLTYYDKDNTFGALGHGISDSDTGALLRPEKGYLYHTAVTHVQPSDAGSPGEITGAIAYGRSSQIGIVEKNTPLGIYGRITNISEEDLCYRTYPVGYKQQIKKQEASMLFALDQEVKSYQIEIQKINYNSREKNKSFVFQIKDPTLIQNTGGIVQGMSGAPIIQNGKIIGAVTHVFVNDPTRGYGIFIEDMLAQHN